MRNKALNSNQLYSTKKMTLCDILPIMEGLDKYIFHPMGYSLKKTPTVIY